MANSRKWLFALAIVALMLGLQGSANAQGFGSAPAFTCVANAGVPPVVRAEGVTELVGDVVLQCSGGTPTPLGAPVPLSNIQVFLNTNITSRLLAVGGGLSEATITIDEPYPSSPNPSSSIAPPVNGATTNQYSCAAVNSVNCATTGIGPTAVSGGAVGSPAATGPVGVNGPYNGTPGHPNIFQGFWTSTSPNSISWLGVPIDSPGTNSFNQLNTRVIRITNVRANACGLGASSTLIPTQIVMYISITGSQQVTINNPQQTVAFIQKGLVAGNTTGNYSQCNNLNISSGAFGTSTSFTPLFVTATEGFGSSFKPRNYAQIQAGAPTGAANTTLAYQNVLGFAYNTESGFVANPSFTTGGDWGLSAGSVGLADTGTQLQFSLAGIGAGVTIYVPTSIPLYPTGASAYCGIPATAPSGSACASSQTGLATLVSGASGSVTIGTSGATTYEAVTAGTAASLVYEVVYSNPNVIEQAVLPMYVSYVSNTGQNLPGIGQSTVTVNFAPLSASSVATTGPIPRFCQPYTAANSFALNVCNCNLLFPFVTNQAGFDTGIAIANTSLDPFGTSTQSGIVTLNYYGGTTGGGAAPAAVKTTSPVTAGSELVFTLSNGGTNGVPATPGFQGYIIAQSNFQYCHGFAFISDLGAQKLAEGYLAIQLDLPVVSVSTGATGLWRTGVGGENMGH